MKSSQKIGLGLACVGTGLFGLNLKINNNGHYFGTGAVFGIGLSLLGSTLYDKAKGGKNK